VRKMMMGWRWVVVWGALTPLAGSFAFCAIGSICPVRLDHRALQDMVRLQVAGLPGASGDFVFLSGDNSMENARTANFGLRPIAFPKGAVLWATLKEQSDRVWSSGFVAVDASGMPYRINGGMTGSWEWRAAPEVAEQAQQKLTRATFVYDSAHTREMFEQRWPFLRSVGNAAAVLSPSPSGSAMGIWRHPANEFGLVRWLRIAALLGIYTTSVLVLLQSIRPPKPIAWLVVGGAVFAAVGMTVAINYVLESVLPGTARWSTGLLWLCLFMIAGWLNGGDARSVVPVLPKRRSARFIVCYALIAYALLFLARLDFDGDFFTNWLPQARFHYLLGRHDPSALLAYGSMQAASYPPGYGVFLSTLMWAADLRREDSFLPGPETSFAILAYRLIVFVLNAALLVLVGVYLAHLRSGSRSGWVAGLAVTLLLIPSTLGKHIAAETILFPMLGSAMVLIAAGRSFGVHALTALGLAIGGMATLIKWEGAVLLALGVLPWLASVTVATHRPTVRTIAIWIAVLTAALTPTIVWKATSDVHNQFFGAATWSGLVSGVPLLGRLAKRAYQLTLASGTFALVFIALPCAVASRISGTQSRIGALVPAGILGLFLGWILIFVFSNLNAVTYLETSYERLVMVPTFGAILYSVESLQIARGSEASGSAASLLDQLPSSPVTR